MVAAASSFGAGGGGFAGEVISRITEKAFCDLKCSPHRITLPDIPSPSTPGLTKYYYPHYSDIVYKVLFMVGKDNVVLSLQSDSVPLDVPNNSFMGPF